MNACAEQIPTTPELIRRVKALIEKEKGPVSWYAAAHELGWSKQRIYNYRDGRYTLDDDAAQVVADRLEWPLETVLACVQLERVKRQDNDTMTHAWERLCRRVLTAATPIFIGFSLHYLPTLPTP